MMQVDLPMWISALALIAGAATLIPAGIRVSQPFQTVHYSESTAEDGTAAAKPRNDIKAILDFRPFGKALADGGQIDDSAPGKSALTLQGVVMGASPELSFALVAVDNARAEAFAIGSKLPNGMTVADIGADQVTLEGEGATLVLRFPMPAKPSATGDASPSLLAPVPMAPGVAALPSRGGTTDSSSTSPLP